MSMIGCIAVATSMILFLAKAGSVQAEDCYPDNIIICELLCQRTWHACHEFKGDPIKFCCVLDYKYRALISVLVIAGFILITLVPGLMCYFCPGCPWYNYRRKLDAELAASAPAPLLPAPVPATTSDQ